MTGPVGSPYPGKYVMLGMAALFALLMGRSARAVTRIVQEERRNAVLGTTIRPDAKRNPLGNLALAVIAAILLVATLVAIWHEWPN